MKGKEVTAFDPVNGFVNTEREYHCDLCLRVAVREPRRNVRVVRPRQLEIDGVLLKRRHYHPQCAYKLAVGQLAKGRTVRVVELEEPA